MPPENITIPPARDIAPLAVGARDAGRLLGGLSERTVWTLIRRAELRAARIGGRTVVRVAELERFLRARESTALAEGADE